MPTDAIDAAHLPERTPITGHRLRWWNRLRYRLGLVPFRRCPGRHRIVNVYGDEINARGGYRSHCLDCEKHWPSLMGASNEVGVRVLSSSERLAQEVRRRFPDAG